MTIQRLAIIGVGLIGGSLARALKRAGGVGAISGWNRNPASLVRAVELGVIDEAAPDLAAAVKDADIVLVATPVGSMAQVFAAMAPYLAPGTVVTDVGSVKGSVVVAAGNALGNHFNRFVPGHPIAGTERAGVDASFPELFNARKVILTPTAATDADAVAAVRALWQAAGARVMEMDVTHHDQVLAATSHLPHMLAYTLVDMLAGDESGREMFQFAAGGFHDFTRIASSDPVMWRDICLGNGNELAAVLRRYIGALENIARWVEQGNGDALLEIFTRAKKARDSLLPAASRDDSPE